MVGVVNTNNGRIIGVEKGTLQWWHEIGHIEYAKDPKGILNQYLQGLCFQFTIAFIVCALFISSFKFFVALFFLAWQGFELYEERWCWNYARKMKGGRDKYGLGKKKANDSR